MLKRNEPILHKIDHGCHCIVQLCGSSPFDHLLSLFGPCTLNLNITAVAET